MQQMIFIADLIACSTCFGHHYAHHQELESIIQVVATCGIWCFGFQVVGMVWSWGLCVQFAGRGPQTGHITVPFCSRLVTHLSVLSIILRYDIKICVLLRLVMQIFPVTGYVGCVRRTDMAYYRSLCFQLMHNRVALKGY